MDASSDEGHKRERLDHLKKGSSRFMGSGAIFNSSARISSGWYKESASGRGSVGADDQALQIRDQVTQINSDQSLNFSLSDNSRVPDQAERRNQMSKRGSHREEDKPVQGKE